MQKWEYLFLTCEYQNDDWRPRYANGQEVGDISHKWSEMTVYDFSNMLGERGWELVDFIIDRSVLSGPGVFRLIFKRPPVE